MWNFTFAIFFKLFLTVNNIGLVWLNELVVLVSPKQSLFGCHGSKAVKKPVPESMFSLLTLWTLRWYCVIKLVSVVLECPAFPRTYLNQSHLILSYLNLLLSLQVKFPVHFLDCVVCYLILESAVDLHESAPMCNCTRSNEVGGILWLLVCSVVPRDSRVSPEYTGSSLFPQGS